MFSLHKQNDSCKNETQEELDDIRYAHDKKLYIQAARRLKEIPWKLTNDSFEEYVVNLTPTADTDYSLWKSTKGLEYPRT